jgi:hypothetical protein
MQNSRKLGVALLSLFVATACENTAPADELDPILDEQAAEIAADAALEDLAQMGLSFGNEFALSSDGGVPSDRSRTVTFYDAAGNEQQGFDHLLTASMNIVSVIENSASRGDWSATVERSRDMTVSGMAGEETSRTWNGTGTSEVSRSRLAGDSERSFDLSSSSVVTDVIRGLPRGDNPYPLSGSISRTLTINIVSGPNGDETRTREVTIVFDGTNIAILTVNGEIFEVDLDARAEDRASRRRDG